MVKDTKNLKKEEACRKPVKSFGKFPTRRRTTFRRASAPLITLSKIGSRNMSKNGETVTNVDTLPEVPIKEKEIKKPKVSFRRKASFICRNLKKDRNHYQKLTAVQECQSKNEEKELRNRYFPLSFNSYAYAKPVKSYKAMTNGYFKKRRAGGTQHMNTSGWWSKKNELSRYNDQDYDDFVTDSINNYNDGEESHTANDFMFGEGDLQKEQFDDADFFRKRDSSASMGLQKQKFLTDYMKTYKSLMNE